MEAIERFMAALATFTAARVLTPLNDNQRVELGRDLPRDAVKTRSQAGQSLSYVDSVYVIEQLNLVFGFDGWSFEHSAPIIRDGARATVMVSGTLRAAGVVRGDTGFAVAASEKPDALETAVKAAVTDCLKRCARTFGARMGLALYDKAQESVGWSFEAQEVIQGFDTCSTFAAYKASRAKLEAAWERLTADEKGAVEAAQKRAAAHLKRVGSTDPNEATRAPAEQAPTQTGPRPASGAAPATPAPAAAAPKPSPSVQLACARIALARTVRTVAAAILACDARGTAAVPVDEAVAARRAAGVDLSELESKLDACRALNAPREQWAVVADVLVAVDTAGSAESLGKVRKDFAERVLALPPALQSGVKSAVDARAADLGAPTVASRLMERAKAARDDEARAKVHADLTAAAQSRRVTKADAEAITNALNGDQAAA